MREQQKGIFQREKMLVPSPFLVTLCGGVAFTLLAFLTALQLEGRYQNARFEQDASDITNSIQKIIGQNIQSLESIVTLYKISEQVERQDFKEFVQVYLQNNSAIKALEWIPRVSSNQRNAFEQAVKQDGFPGFQITEYNSQGQFIRAKQRSEYFPVYFVEPLQDNEAVLGFDLASNPARLKALNQARDQGEVIATEPITLVQTNKKGFLLFLPIFQQDQIINSVETRRKNLKGFALSVFLVEDLMNDAIELAQKRSFDLYIFEQSISQSEQFLYTSASLKNGKSDTPNRIEAKALQEGLHYSDVLDIANQEWLLIAKPNPNYLASKSYGYSWMILSGGLLSVFGFVLYSKNQRRVKLKLQQGQDSLAEQIQQRTAQLHLSNQQLMLEIAERKHIEKALNEVKQRLELATNSAHIGVWDFDIIENRLIWDDRMYELYGIEAENFGGAYEAWTQGVHPDDLVAADGDIQAALAGEREFHPEFRVLWPNGQVRFIQAHAIVLRDETGNPLRMIGVNWDITERKIMENALKQSNEDLEAKVQERTQLLNQQAQELRASNAELEQFAYVASHDLKTPLRGVANLAAWLQDDLAGLIPEESQYHLNLLELRVCRMDEMINGLLQYSRVGRQRIKPELIDIPVLLQEILDSLSPPTSVQVKLPSEAPTIETYKVLLKQVLANLIGNAFKYLGKPDGIVEVGIEDQGDHLQFEVRDNGPGIAQEYHQKIFQIFQTLQSRDRVESTGIGLAIVKKVVESQRGKIFIESQPGQGSTFIFTWPKQPEP